MAVAAVTPLDSALAEFSDIERLKIFDRMFGLVDERTHPSGAKHLSASKA